MLLSPGSGYANPVGGVVSAGAASIESAGNLLTVNQSSQHAVIDWQGFDIGVGEHTRFVQPSASSFALNRVHSATPSIIEGMLSANGRVAIVNPNGIFFSSNAKVDVAGLIATTGNITNSDFMAGRLVFDQPGNASAAIIQDGQVTVREAGLAAFVAPQVQNRGVIEARLGRVQLASADSFTVDMAGDGLLSLAVADPAVAQQLASNSGIISAQGGSVYLTTAAAKGVVDGVVNNSGIIEATAVAKKGGSIILYAEGSTAVQGNQASAKHQKSGRSLAVNSGVLDASGYGSGQTGGTVEVLGDGVGLLHGSFIDASGDAGGGIVHIGGDYLGQGTTPTALHSFVDVYTLIYNDAITQGDGGKTILWADDTMRFYGNIYSRGGSEGGDGGFAETSGKQFLDAQGFVDLTAAKGNKGTYLLDPADITIYGHVDPAFQSTDGTINLAANLRLWIDASDTSAVQLTYSALGTTATGTLGANTITVSANTNLVVGARIRLGGAGAVTAASTLGADTYTITNIAGTTITLDTALTANYAASGVYQGYVSQVNDKSGQGSHATQVTPANRPLWISATAGINGLGSLLFNAATSSTLDITNTLNTALGVYNTVITLMNWSGTNSQMPFGFNGYDIWINGGAIGFNTASGDVRGIANAGFLNSWNQLTSVFYNGATVNNQLYVNGAPQTIACLVGACGTRNISNNMRLSGWTFDNGYKFGGSQSEVLAFNTDLPTVSRHLIDQYQSAKWGVGLIPPGTSGAGGTEALRAMASTARAGDTVDGYSVFTTRYLERLSQTANIDLKASNSITLDLKGDELNIGTFGRSIKLDAGNQIVTASPGSIRTNGGDIIFTSAAIDFNHGFSLSANGGAVVLTSVNAMALPSITAGSILAQTTGTSSDMTLLPGSVLSATGSGNSIILASGRHFINQSVSTALNAGTGRYLVYSRAPSSDQLGGISNFSARYSQNYTSLPPGAIAQGGNLFIYQAEAPALPPVLTLPPSAEKIANGPESFLSLPSATISLQAATASYSNLIIEEAPAPEMTLITTYEDNKPVIVIRCAQRGSSASCSL